MLKLVMGVWERIPCHEVALPTSVHVSVTAFAVRLETIKLTGFRQFGNTLTTTFLIWQLLEVPSQDKTMYSPFPL